jgi:hypothetical protein
MLRQARNVDEAEKKIKGVLILHVGQQAKQSRQRQSGWLKRKLDQLGSVGSQKGKNNG